MKSYGEWRVTVYDVTFGKLKFFNSHTIQLSELYRKTNLGHLAVSGNSPNCYIAKIWRVSPVFSVVKLWRVSRNFMLQKVFISLQRVLQNFCCFCVNLILYLFISDPLWKRNIIEQT